MSLSLKALHHAHTIELVFQTGMILEKNIKAFNIVVEDHHFRQSLKYVCDNFVSNILSLYPTKW